MSNQTSDSFQFMLENRKTIGEVLQKFSTLSEAWKILLEELPEIGEIVKFNTFRSYARFLNVVGSQLDEKDSLKMELDKVRQGKEVLAQELDKVRQRLLKDEPESSAIPKHVEGWGVQLKGHYYRLFKKIDGKVKWIHIGRKWNMELAIRKIRRFKSKTE